VRDAKLLVSSAVMICIFSMASIVDAKSVFVVSGHATGIVKAYSIDPNGSIRWQADIPNAVPNATGLCLWPSKNKMFVTYEGDDTISWASIKSMNRDSVEDDYDTGITGGNGLGGMAVDEQTSLLYVISRGTNRLYAFDYDEYENTLVPVALGQTTDYVELEDITTAIDIAIDEDGSSVMGVPVGRLYVSDLSETVHYYNMATWEYEGSITLERSSVGIGLDKTRGYLYAGYFPGTGGQNYLMRHAIGGDPNTYIEKNMGYPLMDIAVDEDTGYIYLTTYQNYNGRTGAVEVYDPNNWNSSDPNNLVLVDIENDEDFGGQNNGPAGIAVGPPYKPERLSICKEDDVTGCVEPAESITYDIRCTPTEANEYNVVVTDKLPRGVDFVSADPNTGSYDSVKHSYTWEIGFIQWANPNDPTAPADPNVYLELTVQVNDGAEPAGKLVNIANAESDSSFAEYREETPVCCWGDDVIFVDVFATGYKTGVDWENAYTDLADALAQAEKGCGSEIWVAGGIYSPGDNTTDTFTIPDGVVLYGGLAGNEDPVSFDPNSRGTIQYKSILTGFIRIEDEEEIKNDKVVTMGQGTKLHGFVVKDGVHGAYGTGVDFTVERCVIQNNSDRGIEYSSGNLKVNWCIIRDNTNDGIYHSVDGKTLEVNNCKIYGNGENGIYTYDSAAFIKNSEINHNGWDKVDNYDNGIRIQSPSGAGVVHNCTIFRNEGHGIYYSGSYEPDVKNCIFYNNNYHDDLTQFYGGLTAHYSSVTDPCDPNSTDCTKYGDNNIKCDPKFAYININDHNLHLASDSPCIDAGDSGVVETDEVDIDADSRIDDTDVDMGSDEVSCTDGIASPLDFNGDGLVNNNEFAKFGKAWLQYNPDEYTGDDPNDTINWDPRCNLDDTGDSEYVIDLADFVILVEDWLWQACWRDLEKGFGMMSMGGGESMPALSGVEGMLMAEAELLSPTTTQKEESSKPSEPSIEEQIEQIKELLDWLYEIKDEVDEDTWLSLTTTLEEMLKELEADL